MAHQETEAGADAPEAITLDEAAERLSNPPVEEEIEEAPEEVSQSDDEIEAEVEVEAEDAPEVEVEEEVEEVPQVDAPISWSNEQKEVFSSLPPDAQQIIVDRESAQNADYQKKTTTLAEQTKELEAKIEQVNNQGLQFHQAQEAMIQQTLQLPDQTLVDPNSENYNPNLFNQQVAEYNQRQAQLQQHQREVANYQALEQQRQELAFKQRIVERDEQLRTDLLPDFVKPEYQKGLMDFANEMGFEEADFEAATAPEIVLLDMAMKFSKLESKKPDIKAQVKKVPKVQKPGSSNKASPQALAKQKLKKSGSIHDAAALLG